jgi:hypothetical protein
VRRRLQLISRFIVPGNRGIALSIDALLAMVLFLAVIAFVTIEPVSEVQIVQPKVLANQMVDDAIATMDNTGFIMRSVEDGNALAIENKLRGLLPGRIDFRVEMLQYTSDLDDPLSSCRTNQSFDDCFPDPYPDADDNPQLFFEIGNQLPQDREIFHGRKLFVKKEPGDCELEVGLSGKEIVLPRLLFQSSDENFLFGSMIRDASTGELLSEVECGQETIVDLNLGRKEESRTPVDIIFAASKNETMGQCAIASGNSFYTGSENQISADFQKVADINVTDTKAIDVLLSWQSCTDCPDFYMISPTTSTEYGKGKASTLQDSTSCNIHDKSSQSVLAYYYDWRYLDYLAIGSGLVESGMWELYVKNPEGVDYNISVKFIDNNHFVEDAGSPIQEWDEPIAKIEIAKVLITEFTLMSNWRTVGPDNNHDKYAYAQIGNADTNPNTGSSIQPASNLRDAGDISTPFLSQLKNLDFQMDLVPGPAYSYALDHTDIVNDVLANSFPAEDRTKFAIIYGDREDIPSSYNIDGAIADAVSKGIYYYTVDFNQSNLNGDGTCKNADLEKLAEQTGGKCYPAGTENVLREIVELISFGIGDKSAFNPDPGSATLSMTFEPDFQQSFLYNFQLDSPEIWDGQDLEYQNITINAIPWIARFNMNIACDFSNCSQFFAPGKTLNIPPTGASFDYTVGGQSQTPITWPVADTTTVSVKYTDLEMRYLNGFLYGDDDLELNYLVSNEGYLDVDLADLENPAVNFYKGSSSLNACPASGGMWIAGQDLSAEGVLDARYGGSGTVMELQTSKKLADSGYICIYLNEPLSPDTRNVKECIENNWAIINCAVPKTYLYAFDYWTWEK